MQTKRPPAIELSHLPNGAGERQLVRQWYGGWLPQNGTLRPYSQSCPHHSPFRVQVSTCLRMSMSILLVVRCLCCCSCVFSESFILWYYLRLPACSWAYSYSYSYSYITSTLLLYYYVLVRSLHIIFVLGTRTRLSNVPNNADPLDPAPLCQLWKLASTHVVQHIYIYIYTHTCMYVCIYICMYIYIYIYTYIYTYIYNIINIMLNYICCIILFVPCDSIQPYNKWYRILKLTARGVWSPFQTRVISYLGFQRNAFETQDESWIDRWSLEVWPQSWSKHKQLNWEI